jgi:ubiquinone/menaquinone biosynthesis C-methylase UbiE
VKEELAPVRRSHAQARAAYDRLSRGYERLAGSSEWPCTAAGLELLAASPAETVLEVGCGVGRALKGLRQAVGSSGKVCGVDLSAGMLRQAGRRLGGQVPLVQADALLLPFPGGCFDAVFVSFTLELLDTPEIPAAISEWRRVLHPPLGRVGVVSLAQGSTWPVRLYEMAHAVFPTWVDCRPIQPGRALEEAGFTILGRQNRVMWGLPVEIVVARPHLNEICHSR